MGATFLSVGPILAAAADPSVGLRGFYGALLSAGLLGILIAPLIGRLLVFFPFALRLCRGWSQSSAARVW